MALKEATVFQAKNLVFSQNVCQLGVNSELDVDFSYITTLKFMFKSAFG
jgi:hypothetical protein